MNRFTEAALVSILLFSVVAESSPGPSPAGRGGTAIVPPYEAKQVKNTLLRLAAEPIQKCFKTWAKKHPQFTQGKIHVDWEIQPDGRIKNLHVIHSDLEGMNGCVLGMLKKVVFPPPPDGKPYYVAHKFLLKNVMN